MKTEPMQHQSAALDRMAGREYFGLFMEQGTGKTWCLLADAERLFLAGELDALLVVAPNGVHINWVRREIPRHLGAPRIARAWRSGAGKRYMAAVNEIFEHPDAHYLRILVINIDALLTGAGYSFCQRFLAGFPKAMLVVDESTRIKNPRAARTRAALRLRTMARYARIATGTPITRSPIDIFAQMEFLNSGLLGTTSYRAFVAEYSDLLPASHPMMRALAQRNLRAACAQIVARDAQGLPRWRNLDKLHRMLEPHTFRVTKAECLDLPPKIYERVYFQLTGAQQKAYRLMRRELRMEINGETTPVQLLNAGAKLQQITSGFLLSDGKPHYIEMGNPRLNALQDLVQDLPGAFIVWAQFREELRAIAERLTDMGISVVQYHGGVSPKDRELGIEAFQNGQAQAFVGHPAAAGLGLTLTAAQTVVYFSNGFNLEHRLQSEDRCHRKGTRSSVVYIDLVAEDTIDESVATALCNKANIAAAILGDLK